MTPLRLALIGLVIVLLVGSQFIFTVHEREQVVMLRLGDIVRTDFEPGLYFKIPLYHRIRRFERRILEMDRPAERFLTSEQKNMIVDFFVKWRIDEVGPYFRATNGDEGIANTRISQILKNGLRDEFGSRTIQESISGERNEIMDSVRTLADEKTEQLGIRVLDVRLKRIDLPAEVSNSVFQRMEKERATVAQSFRARGEQAAREIRASAERQREEILADAYRQAETIRGEGDAKATRTYAEAFGADPEFFTLYRSLNAYRQSFAKREDVLVLDPSSDFFRYFKDPMPAGGFESALKPGEQPAMPTGMAAPSETEGATSAGSGSGEPTEE